ncbi:MAG: sigma-70 family RNA polymerase sigma factor [Mediterranea sp.]|jgi:RNA polymerase sigma factor (sigma-70 family)|nr:sigma-70 family RNA polymerase sigma factor [Mediterranea sp.]
MKARKEEETLCERLYKENYALLLNYGMRLFPDKELIQDCIQDLFVHLYKDARYSILSDSPKAYLLRALRNTLYNKMYHRQAYLPVEEATAFYLPEDEELFNRFFSQSDESLRVGTELRSALNRLNPHQKQVLYLRYIHGLSYREIALALSINEQSAMNLHSRTLLRLRTFLADKALILGLLLFFLQKGE